MSEKPGAIQSLGGRVINGRDAFKSGDWRAKIKLHISDAIEAKREAERRVDQAVAAS
jgi:hypothetical protein